MNTKRTISALMLILGACLLCALAACEQPVGGGGGGGGGDKPPANSNPQDDPPKDDPPKTDPGTQQPPPPPPPSTIVTVTKRVDFETALKDPAITQITIGFSDNPITIDSPTQGQAVAFTIIAGSGKTKTIIGKPGQAIATSGNYLFVNGNVTLKDLDIIVDLPSPNRLNINPPGFVLGTNYNPLIIEEGTLTLGAGSSLTFADGTMPYSTGKDGKLVIEPEAEYIDNHEASIDKISKLGIWKAGFSEVTIKTKADGSDDGVLQMNAVYFTGPANPRLDLTATTVSNPLVLSKSGAAYKTTANGPVNVNTATTWLDNGDILEVKGGPLNFKDSFVINKTQTMDIISGTVNIAAGSLTIGGSGGAGTLKLGLNTTVNLNLKETTPASTGLAISETGTLITAENSEIVVERNRTMVLATTLTKVVHDGRITVQDGGSMADRAADGGMLWKDGNDNGGSVRLGSLKIMYGGKGLIGAAPGAEFAGTAGTPIRISNNGSIINDAEEYIELRPTSYKLNGTATLNSNFGIGPGYTLEILDKSELVVPSGNTLTLGYNGATQSGVNVILRGRSDDLAVPATASNITVQSGGKLIDQRPFTNSAGTEQYLWPITGYRFEGTAGRPLITIAQGGSVETAGAAVVIGAGGKLQPGAGDFQVLSNNSYGDLALTGDATITSVVAPPPLNTWYLPQKLYLNNGADLTITNVRLYVVCPSGSSLPSRLIGSGSPTGSTISLTNGDSFLGWSGNDVDKKNVDSPLTWLGNAW